jgi:hypothetical protein
MTIQIQELITVEARIVIASVDTYLRFAEAVNRLDLTETEKPGIEVLREGAGAATEKAARSRAPRRRRRARTRR